MDRKIVLTKTAKGLMEAAGKTSFVGREARNVLTHVDGKATIGDLQAKLKLPERKLDTHLGALMRQGLVREFVVAPLSITPPSQMSALGHTLDFSALLPRDLSQEARQQNAEAEAIAREIAAAAVAREQREERAASPAPVADAEEHVVPPASPAPVADVEVATEVEDVAAPLPKSPEAVDPFAAFRMRADLTLREAEQRVHAEAEKARVELRAKAERESVERGKQDAEAQALRAEMERRQREEQSKKDRQAQKQAAEKAKQEGIAQARRAIEEQTRRAEEDLRRREAEEQMRKAAAVEQARQEAAEKARREAIAAAEAQARAQAAAEMGIQIEIETPSGEEAPVLPEPSPSVRRGGGDTLSRRDADAEARKKQEDMRRKVREEERAKAKAQAGAAARLRKEERAREVAEAEARAQARAKEHERDTAMIASRLQNFRQRRGGNVGVRIGLALVLTLVLAVVLLPYVPVDPARYEALASTKLGQPVKIGTVAYMPYPLPHIRFEDVRVGTTQITQVRARPQWSTLWSDSPVFEELELRGLRARPALLGNLLWGRMAADAALPARVKLHDLQIEGLALPSLRGAMNIDTAGRRMLDLSNESGDASVHLTRQGEEAVFEMRAKTTQGLLPLPLVLQNLNVRGIVSGRGIQISAFDAQIYDGVIKGSGSLTQGEQWLLQAKIEATQLDVRQFAPALEGRLRGEGQIQSGGAQWQELAAVSKLSGSFEIEKGQINDVDLVRSLREGNFAGGKTPFTLLRGQAVLEKDKLSLRALQMDSGLLKAAGNAEWTPKGLSGRLNADMRSSAAGNLRGNFALSGDSRQIKLQPLP